MLIPPHSRLSNLASHVYSWLGKRSHSGLRVALGLWLILNWALPASALTVQDIPSPREHGGWVSDTAEQVSAPMERRLNGLITFLEAKTTAEMAVVTIPDTPPEVSPKSFATELFNTWGVGKAEKNNGVLMLLSMGDRRIEIELGPGMDDVVSSDRLTSLIQNTLRPLLQSGDVDQALWLGVGAIVADLTGIAPNAPLVPPWGRPIYSTFLVLGMACLMVSILSLRWQYQQRAPLPPTGNQPFSGYLKLTDIDFDRLVETTPHRPKRPFFLLLILACSFPLVAPALVFWGTSLWVVPFDTRTDFFLFFLVVLPANLSGLLLILYLEDWLHPVRGNAPFNLLECWEFGIRPEMTLSDRIITVTVELLPLGYLAILIIGGVRLTWLVYNWLWTLATPFTPTLQIAIAAPLFVALSNAAIAAYYLRENRGLSRPTPGYCCETCNGDIIDLTNYSSELRELFPYRSNTTYRAWRCPTCHPTLSQDGIFLFTHEERSSTPSSSSAKSQSTRTKPRKSSNSYDSYDSTGSISSSSSNDFGGGSSDGGGVGDNW